MQSPEKQKQERARRETLNPWVIGAPVVVDVWVMPWCNQADLMLQCQLAYMLSRDDFWTKHSYLRVCGVVGPFGELGADDSMDDGATLEERRSELYNQVWRSMRIPATIEVFNVAAVKLQSLSLTVSRDCLSLASFMSLGFWTQFRLNDMGCSAQTVPDVWESCKREFQGPGSIGSPSETESVRARICTVLNAVVCSQNANTAVSMMTCPEVPERSSGSSAGERDPAALLLCCLLRAACCVLRAASCLLLVACCFVTVNLT